MIVWYSAVQWYKAWPISHEMISSQFTVSRFCSSCSIYLKQSQYVRQIHLISLGCCFYWSERVKIIWQPNKSCEIFFPINDALLMRRLLKVRSQHMRHFKWGKKELIMASWIAQMYRTQMHKYINHKKMIKNHINHCQTRFLRWLVPCIMDF